MSRTLEIRHSTSLISSVLQVPFAYIQKQFGYPVESILRPIHGESKVSLGLYPNTFPNTIKEYYWISTRGSTDNVQGGKVLDFCAALGILDSGLYFLYTTHSTSVEQFANKKASMNLWVASKFANIIQFAMSEDVYQMYFMETV